MERDEIGAGEQFVEIDLCHPERLGALRRKERVEGDDPHLQAERPVGGDRADIAAADDSEGLAGDLDAHEAVLFPFAGLGRGVGGGNLAGQREHHGDGVFGGGDRIAEGRVHDDHAARGGGGNVDIVHADAGAADDAQILGVLQDLGCDLGRRADGEAVIIADDRGELVLVLAERRLEIDLDPALLEDGDRGGRKGVGNENTRRHIFLLREGRGACPPSHDVAVKVLLMSDFSPRLRGEGEDRG